MVRSNLYVKVVIEHEAGEQAERLGQEICRHIEKLYGVRTAEVAGITTLDE